MTSIKRVDDTITLYLNGYGETVWQGWLWRASLGQRDPKHLQAYQPRMLEQVDGRWYDSGRHRAYIRDTGRRGPGQWEIVLYDDVVGAERTKGDAKSTLLGLLGVEY